MMKPRFAFVASMLVAAVSPTAAAGSGVWEVWYSVNARVRGVGADADLQAGGRLAMAGHRDEAGGPLELSLVEVREHPWKHYWVDPIGPFGKEVKVASVVTLPEATWAALEAARAANLVDARMRHERWHEVAERPRELDGSFAFIVIGPAGGRFRFQVGADATVSGVVNLMTQHWLPGPFDQFIGTWGEPRAEVPGAELPGNGYWFWNQGEVKPFDYEPHTYRAFAAALELLALPGPRADGVYWEDVGDRAIRVLETLAPRIGLRGLPALDANSPPVAELEAIHSPLPDGGRRRELSARDLPSGASLERETMFSWQGPPASDRIRVRFLTKRGGTLEVEVGYRAEDLAEESK